MTQPPETRLGFGAHDLEILGTALEIAVQESSDIEWCADAMVILGRLRTAERRLADRNR